VRYRQLHPWAVSPPEAIEIQQQLRKQISAEGAVSEEEVKYIAGLDIGLQGETMRAAAVVLEYPSLTPVETSVVKQAVPFPYVPGLLSFREAPAMLAALEQLRHEADLVMVDGQGIAHPRRLGIASHLGLLIDRPTIGCAKSILVGRHGPVGEQVGDYAALVDRAEVIGVALRTRPGTKPLYISVGHRISLEAAVAWILRCGRGYKLPEPTRRAHALASAKPTTAVW
jgi:deoxyribonuclease V